jgi:hypothetical protein
MPKCSICGEKKNKEELIGDLCQECSSALLKEEEYDIGMDDFS